MWRQFRIPVLHLHDLDTAGCFNHIFILSSGKYTNYSLPTARDWLEAADIDILQNHFKYDRPPQMMDRNDPKNLIKIVNFCKNLQNRNFIMNNIKFFKQVIQIPFLALQIFLISIRVYRLCEFPD